MKDDDLQAAKALDIGYFRKQKRFSNLSDAGILTGIHLVRFSSDQFTKEERLTSKDFLRLHYPKAVLPYPLKGQLP